MATKMSETDELDNIEENLMMALTLTPTRQTKTSLIIYVNYYFDKIN